ncbi:MAG: orotate phosphoribosyltransferase [Patiriisocius sp.]
MSLEYFDRYLFESDPNLLSDIAEAMVELIPDGTEILAGLEMGGIPVVTMVEDVVTSGGQIILSHRDLVESGGNVDHAICVIDRQAGGLDKLKTAGIELKSLFKKSDLTPA